MARGGARNRSGPQPDPNSGRSDRRGLRLAVLPAEGYDGEVPAFPLQPMQLFREYDEWSGRDRTHVREFDEAGTESFREREAALWAWVWSLPQAAAWAREPWRWHTVAMWVRTAVVCEGPDAQAADKNSLHRFADQIGMTPAGLKENGWSISVDEVGEKRVEPVEDEPEDDPRARLTVVSNGGA
ncbi:MAG TPA: hypothetical protein VJT49_14755 [Amycolatopsis sp.]|uniref:hypothetical protein n=1 Tax=Amycolatopsis sp. TaxID=37632 RepID=UPI002B493377|nr:hypothetical protein [Amycolatopsis sp.]HKS46338.1 hypothetical protein [Amycolatopsis sp.]